jgi:calcium/calmodulin-dependent 3',5'-cyclic nucleotide phosphodiesterase
MAVIVRGLIAPNMFCVSEQGSLTIVRRSSTKKSQNHTDTVADCPSSSSFADDETLDAVDLDTDNLPAVDTPDACDKAAVRFV